MVEEGLCPPPMPAPAPGSDPDLLPQPVHLYRLDAPDHHCPYGERARQLLKERGIPFQDHRLTSQEEAEQFQATQGVTTTPQVFAGNERIGGYSDLAVRLGVAAADQDPATGTGRSYRPVLAVFGVAAVAAWALAIIKVTSYSSGKYENYLDVEEDALEYLIKHAKMRKNSEYILKSIKGINQTTKEVVFNAKDGVKIELEGFAIFQRK
jgi:glutaredoxin